MTQRTIYRWLCMTLIMAVGAIPTDRCVGEESERSIFFIEEDWELVLNEPAPEINSPQVSFFVFPNSEDENSYFQLQMNYAAEESYSSGGFRVTAVRQSNPVDDERSDDRQLWTIHGDRIRWTTVMASMDNKYLFAIKNGQSEDWGEFGGPDYLVEMIHEGSLGLSRYTPVKSLENVDIGFGANRVGSITLKNVRVVYNDGHVRTVSVNQSVEMN
ncbi:hypothetical protein [Crateriforma conspicua]|uniref:Uncharacterized protein n=1 Tax=Crateriforma conspicua TaxID=2527996 RepID=A0A5C6G335_9PLAN|nr:hypothetical protein [Crateriforma conspicua]TWU67613.1 hypothetical protein V7x_31880 [Crateriforma conspicua]